MKDFIRITGPRITSCEHNDMLPPKDFSLNAHNSLKTIFDMTSNCHLLSAPDGLYTAYISKIIHLHREHLTSISEIDCGNDCQSIFLRCSTKFIINSIETRDPTDYMVSSGSIVDPNNDL
jgi:hypothetical protein